MEIIDSYPQQSDEWFSETAGSIGGSSIGTAVSNGKGRKDLMISKAVELITGKKSKSKKLWQYERGNKYEPAARKHYIMKYRAAVKQVALIKLTDHKHYSPDFLLDVDGFGEIKVREPHVFLQATDDKNMGTSDRRQVQWGFRVMGRSYCDYIQYCPEFEFTEIDPMFVMRIYPDEKEIKDLDNKCNKFIGELINYVNRKKEAA